MHLEMLQRRLALAVAENPAVTKVAVPIETVRGVIKLLREGVVLHVSSAQSEEAAAQPSPVSPRVKPLCASKKLSVLPGYADLAVRARNLLLANKVVTVAQLASLTEADLLKMPGMGLKSVRDILTWAKGAGVYHG